MEPVNRADQLSGGAAESGIGAELRSTLALAGPLAAAQHRRGQPRDDDAAQQDWSFPAGTCAWMETGRRSPRRLLVVKI